MTIFPVSLLTDAKHPKLNIRTA